MKRTSICIIYLILIAVVLTSCGQQSMLSARGKMLHLKKSEVTENGFYVHDKNEDTFSPVISASGYDGMVTEYESSRFVWLGNDKYDLAAAIPNVDGKSSELVFFCGREDKMPDVYILERYKKLGYTVGVHFEISEDDRRLYMNTQAPCKSSMAQREVSALSKGMLPLYSMDESKLLPKEDVDTDVNLLLGLKKGEEYQFGVLDGTKYVRLDLKADTLCFKSINLYMLEDAVTETDKDYFVINMPDEISQGYYYINDNGLFSYAKGSAAKEGDTND